MYDNLENIHMIDLAMIAILVHVCPSLIVQKM